MKTSPVKGNSKRVLWIFAFVLVAIASVGVFGNNGLVDVYKLGNERNAISEKTIRMQEENKALAAEIELLKTDNRYIAKVARDELGMIGKDEVLYKMDGEGK